MKLRTFSTAVAALALCTTIFSCTKTEDVAIEQPIEKTAPRIPSGDRIIIHFGTSTYLGCMYSFSNCIWIGWGASALNHDARYALQFDQGAEANQYFGQYFPLTADYKLDAASAKSLGLGETDGHTGCGERMRASSGVSDDRSTGKRGVVGPDRFVGGNLRRLAIE